MDKLFKAETLCVVGNVNRDVKVHSVPGGRGLLRDGETSVPAITETIGGGGANSACAAAALGARVRFIGKVGADGLGRQLRRAMEKHGVRTHLKEDSACPTGTTVALGLSTGHRHFLSCLPNNRTLRFKDLDLDGLAGCKHLLRADVWFSEQMLENGNRLLLSRARARGLSTSLDINFDPVWSSGPGSLIGQRKRALRKVLPLVDMAHGNVRELCEFADASNLATALDKLGQWGAGCVVVHLGKKGAGYYANGEFIIEAANPARNPVHSTGTGDVLSICMILLAGNRKLAIRDKLRISNAIVRDFMEAKLDLIPRL